MAFFLKKEKKYEDAQNRKKYMKEVHANKKKSTNMAVNMDLKSVEYIHWVPLISSPLISRFRLYPAPFSL